MKITLSLILLSLFPLLLSAQSDQPLLSGQLTDFEGRPVAYANVILKCAQDTLQVYGVGSDSDGRFSLKAPRGSYYLHVFFLGYQPHSAEISLIRSMELEPIVLTPSAVDINAVLVVGQAVTRESDRFVVNVAASPYAVGQTAKEMLELSPGVWVDERSGISINGKEGTQVIVNDRILRESGEELVSYLKTIRAEDIVRIEVIPTGGVEYEAATQGGVIRITLRRQRDDGFEGSVSMRYTTRLSWRPRESFHPGLNLNYRANKLSLYLDLSENSEKKTAAITGYRNNSNGIGLNFAGETQSRLHGGTLRGGGIYEINEKHTVGAEVNFQGYLPQKRHQLLDETVAYPNGDFERIHEEYTIHQRDKAMTLSGNYIARLDEQGSSFKLLLDYARTRPHQRGGYLDSYADRDGNPTGERIYRSLSESSNDLYSVAGDFDLRAGASGRIKTGFKYMFSEVDSEMLYEYLTEGDWVKHPDQSYATQYDEHISALYGAYTHRFGEGISLSAGLRIEHTYARPAAEGLENIERQNYLNFFPNANLSFRLNEAGSHRLIFSYARRIRRPNFWLLVPLRMPTSATETRIGNPKLKPRLSDELTVDWVIDRKYTVTAGALLFKDDWSWLAHVDPENPEALITQPENRDHNNMFYLALNVPLKVTSWWNLNANASGNLGWYAIDEFRKTNHHIGGSLNNTFTLREGTNLLLGAIARTATYRDYTKRNGNCVVNVGVTQQLLKKRVTGAVHIYDLLNTANAWTYNLHPDYSDIYFYKRSQPVVTLSLRYNFKTGKEFKARKVESGADTSRISGAQ